MSRGSAERYLDSGLDKFADDLKVDFVNQIRKILKRAQFLTITYFFMKHARLAHLERSHFDFGSIRQDRKSESRGC